MVKIKDKEIYIYADNVILACGATQTPMLLKKSFGNNFLKSELEVHLNLSQVQYMDSSGISVLIESHQRALEKNTKVIIKDVSKSVLKVIMMAKLEQILNLE